MNIAKSIPFVGLQRLHNNIEQDISIAINRVINESGFILGEEVERFENEFAEYCSANFAIGVGSGTDALFFALKACGVGMGDEVITAVNTFSATAEAICMCGAVPVFIDIHETTYLIDEKQIEEKISERTKAIIPVHLYGQPADMNAINDLAKRYGLKVIEDACQAHGASYEGTVVGAIGDAGCFSFYPGKNLGAMGDGGIVVTNNAEIAERIRLLRNHGEKSKYNHVETGYCSRLDGMQAAILRAKLPYLDEWNDWRITVASLYDELLAGSVCVLPVKNANSKHIFHLYVIRVKNRDEMMRALTSNGIASGIHYPVPLHLQTAFDFCGYREGDFRVAESTSKEILSLPIYPYLTQEEVKEIADVVRRYSA
jgi:dTDP-4-amino-4,6-dideoxygalactose transaminase